MIDTNFMSQIEENFRDLFNDFTSNMEGNLDTLTKNMIDLHETSKYHFNDKIEKNFKQIETEFE